MMPVEQQRRDRDGAAAAAPVMPEAKVDLTPAAAQVRAMLQRGRMDPAAIAQVLHAQPQARGEVLALLQQTVGNAVVQRVLAAIPASGAAAPAAAPAAAASEMGGGAGRPLPAALRIKMEASLGTELGAVRVHEGGQAAADGAIAYAHGNDLYFQPGAYDPDSPAGQQLIGHELTHVVQQRNGRVPDQRLQAKGPAGSRAAANADPALEAEADAMGARAARGEATGMSAPATAPSAPAVQRYRDVGKDPWRMSNNGNLLARTEGKPGSRTQDLFAAGPQIETANHALADAGSYIRLGPGEDTKTVVTSNDQAWLDGEDHEGNEEEIHQNHVLTRVVPRFERTAAPPGKFKRVYNEMSAKQDEGEKKLLTPSDCNETARLIMGVSNEKNDEQAIVTTGEGPQSVGPNDIKLDKSDGSNTSHLEQTGLNAIDTALKAYKLLIDTRELPQEQVSFFKTNLIGWPRERMKFMRRLAAEAPAVYADFAAWAKIDTKVDPQIGDALVTYRLNKTESDPSCSPRLYRAFVEVLTDKLHVEGERAKEILTAVKITEQTPYHEMDGLRRKLVDYIVEHHGNSLDHGPAREGLTKADTDNGLWNKHWGGVVMKDGTDFITLENDASTEKSETSVTVPVVDKVINKAWGFAMYGTQEKEQTFHHQNMQTEDFGDHATTMTFRRPTKK